MFSDQERREINHHHPALHVFDKATGELICDLPMQMNVSNVPMTYMWKGKQYIVVAMGGLFDKAKLVALALP